MKKKIICVRFEVYKKKSFEQIQILILFQSQNTFRQENFSFHTSVNCSHLAVIPMHLSIHDFPYQKKCGETYQSVKLNAPNFSLIGVTAHSWWNLETGPIPPYIHWHFNTFIVNFYAGQLLAPAETLAKAKKLICCFGPFYAIFLMFSSNLSNFNN